MKKGKLVVISGFSGVGKGTVVSDIINNCDDFKVSVSATTRSPREGEENGVHYFFLTKDEFEKMIEDDKLLEYAQYVDNYYGTPLEFVDNTLDSSVNVVLEIEAQGAMQVKEKRPDAELIFILPPDADTLKNRLVGRNTESADVIEKRLQRAASECEFVDAYDHYVLNDQVSKCRDDIIKIVNDDDSASISQDIVNNIKEDILKFKEGE